MQAPAQPPPNLPLDQRLSSADVDRYGRYSRAQYRQVLNKIPRTLREIRNADVSMDALAVTNNSWLTVPFKQQNAQTRVNTPMAGLSFREELQQKYAAPSRMERYAITTGKNVINVADEFQEGGPVTEGTGTGTKSYPVFRPFRGGKRRKSRRATRKNRKNRKNRKTRRN
jgi:hypothetical protein